MKRELISLCIKLEKVIPPSEYRLHLNVSQKEFNELMRSAPPLEDFAGATFDLVEEIIAEYGRGVVFNKILESKVEKFKINREKIRVFENKRGRDNS